MSRFGEDADSARIERWIVAQAKSTWRKGKCLWDWTAEDEKRRAAKVAAAAVRKAEKAKKAARP